MRVEYLCRRSMCVTISTRQISYLTVAENGSCVCHINKHTHTHTHTHNMHGSSINTQCRWLTSDRRKWRRRLCDGQGCPCGPRGPDVHRAPPFAWPATNDRTDAMSIYTCTTANAAIARRRYTHTHTRTKTKDNSNTDACAGPAPQKVTLAHMLNTNHDPHLSNVPLFPLCD